MWCKAFKIFGRGNSEIKSQANKNHNDRTFFALVARLELSVSLGNVFRYSNEIYPLKKIS